MAQHEARDLEGIFSELTEGPTSVPKECETIEKKYINFAARRVVELSLFSRERREWIRAKSKR